MLRVVDLERGASLSCTLNPQTTALQVLHAIQLRKSARSQDALFAVWLDSHHHTRARRLRGEDHPLRIVGHLRSTTNGKRTPKLERPSESCHLLLMHRDGNAAACAARGVVLDPHSGFFAVLQGLGEGDLCAYFITNNELPAWWWVLRGERLCFYPEGHERAGEGFWVSLVNAKLVSLGPTEFEVQTPLVAYRLRAVSSPQETGQWTDTIQQRIATATDNDLVAVADAMIADEERRSWRAKKDQALLLDSFQAWWSLPQARAVLVRFARETSAEDYDLCVRYASGGGGEAGVGRELEFGLFARMRQNDKVFERLVAQI